MVVILKQSQLKSKCDVKWKIYTDYTQNLSFSENQNVEKKVKKESHNEQVPIQSSKDSLFFLWCFSLVFISTIHYYPLHVLQTEVYSRNNLIRLQVINRFIQGKNKE